jgi:hypothetical protein
MYKEKDIPSILVRKCFVFLLVSNLDYTALNGRIKNEQKFGKFWNYMVVKTKLGRDKI